MDNSLMKKRIYITDNLQNAIWQGKDQSGECAMPLTEMAKRILKHEIARSKAGLDGKVSGDLRFLDRDGAVRILSEIMHKEKASLQIIKLNDTELTDLRTCEEVWNMMTVIRLNPVLYQDAANESRRFRDLDFLRKKYEETLKVKNLLDDPGCIAAALSILKDMDTEEARSILSEDITVISEETDTLSNSERELIDKLQQLSGTKEEKRILQTVAPGTAPDTQKIAFFRGYGIANEIKWAIYNILSNKQNPDDVTIYYLSEQYEPFIISEFEGRGIPYNISGGKRLTNSDIYQLIKDIVEWVRSDHEITALSCVLRNPIISFKAVTEPETDDANEDLLQFSFEPESPKSPEDSDEISKDKSEIKTSYLDGLSVMTFLLRGMVSRHDRNLKYNIGIGYDRYKTFIAKVRDNAEIDKQFLTEEKDALQRNKDLRIMEFLDDLTDIFGNEDELDMVGLTERLLSFIGKYTRRNGNRDCFTTELRRLKESFIITGDTLHRDNALECIQKTIKDIKGSDDAVPGAVSIHRWSGFTRLNKKYVYFMGLTDENMNGGTKESAVLRDEEMKAIFGDSDCIPLHHKQAELMDRHLKNTLCTFNGDKVYLGYPEYDTVNMIEQSPSNAYALLYKEKRMSEGLGKWDEKEELKKLPSFEYGNALTLDKEAEVKAEKAEDHLHKKQNFNIRTGSASGLQTLNACPRKYAYSYIYNLREPEYPEIGYKNWLSAKDKGTFMHAVLENYCNTVFGDKKREAYPSSLDVTVLDGIIAKEKTVMLELFPEVDAKIGIADMQIEEMKGVIVPYLENLHAEYSTSGADDQRWEFCAAEYEFRDVPFYIDTAINTDKSNGSNAASASPVQVENQAPAGKTSLPTNGVIDRIDASIDWDARTIYFRIVDYKSGIKTVASEYEHKELLQHIIYFNALGSCHDALKDILKKKYTERVTELDTFEVKHDLFIYQFLTGDELKEDYFTKPVMMKQTYSLQKSQEISALEKEREDAKEQAQADLDFCSERKEELGNKRKKTEEEKKEYESIKAECNEHESALKKYEKNKDDYSVKIEEIKLQLALSRKQYLFRDEPTKADSVKRLEQIIEIIQQGDGDLQEIVYPGVKTLEKMLEEKATQENASGEKSKARGCDLFKKGTAQKATCMYCPYAGLCGEEAAK